MCELGCAKFSDENYKLEQKHVSSTRACSVSAKYWVVIGIHFTSLHFTLLYCP